MTFPCIKVFYPRLVLALSKIQVNWSVDLIFWPFSRSSASSGSPVLLKTIKRCEQAVRKQDVNANRLAIPQVRGIRLARYLQLCNRVTQVTQGKKNGAFNSTRLLHDAVALKC